MMTAIYSVIKKNYFCRVIWLKDDRTYELIKINDLSKEDWFRKAF